MKKLTMFLFSLGMINSVAFADIEVLPAEFNQSKTVSYQFSYDQSVEHDLLEEVVYRNVRVESTDGKIHKLHTGISSELAWCKSMGHVSYTTSGNSLSRSEKLYGPQNIILVSYSEGLKYNSKRTQARPLEVLLDISCRL